MALDPRAVRYANIPVTSTSPIRLDFPVGQYLVGEPVVLVTVYGAPTEVDVTSTPEAVSGLGEVYTYILLTFAAAAVGKRAAVCVVGQGF